MIDLIWADFQEAKNDPHQWVYNDIEMKARYAARKIDGTFEFSIRDELTTDPRAVDVEVIAFLQAVNTYRGTKGLADRRSRANN